MATSKLTLSIQSDTIERAKQYARRHHTSLSKIVQNLLNDIAKEEVKEDSLLEKFKHLKTSPDIEALKGILKGKYPEDMDYKDMKYEYFKDKYDL